MKSLTSDATPVLQALTERIGRNDIDVPMLPEIAQRVLQLLNDPESDANQLAQTIQSDPLMAAHILRIANSPAYSANSNISSLQQAISRLGMNTLSEITLAASINAKMFNAPRFSERIKDLWEDALRTAVWAKEFAHETRYNMETAFLCGLLHNMGRPVLLQCLTEDYPDLSEEDMLGIEERLFIDTNRAVVDAWHLPDVVKSGVTLYHGDPEQLPEVAKIVQVGYVLAKWSSTPDRSIDELSLAEVPFALATNPDLAEFFNTHFNDVHATIEVMRT